MLSRMASSVAQKLCLQGAGIRRCLAAIISWHFIPLPSLSKAGSCLTSSDLIASQLRLAIAHYMVEKANDRCKYALLSAGNHSRNACGENLQGNIRAMCATLGQRLTPAQPFQRRICAPAA